MSSLLYIFFEKFFYSCFSSSNMRFFVSVPPAPLNWPQEPSALTTRWQGTINGSGLFAITLPIARAALGLSDNFANSP
jgi:hypothetical protein